MKKKITIIFSIVIAAVIAAAIAVGVYFYKAEPTKDTETTVADKNEFEIDYDKKENSSENAAHAVNPEDKKNKIEKKKSNNAQVGIIVNDFLKIESLAEVDGRLSVIVENVSKDDIEYALLTVTAGKEKLTFKITALLSGEKAVLICEENRKYNKDESYVFWTVSNKILFKQKPELHSDIFEVTENDGSLTLKNKRSVKVEGPIYVCYKRIADGMKIGSETRRVVFDTIDGNGESTVRTSSFDKNSCEIIFIDYAK